MSNKDYPIQKTAEEWKASLSPSSYHILREKGTEPPFSGHYNDHYEVGVYHCKGCHAPLYKSENKFDSHCGWPSYDAAIEGAIEYREDRSHGMLRVEIVCAQCGGHQGHVFDDGPTATRMRYCINSGSIGFTPKDEAKN